MVYYNHVHLILDPTAFVSIIDQIGLRFMEYLFYHESISVELPNNMPTIMTTYGNYAPKFMNFIHKNGKTNFDYLDYIMRAASSSRSQKIITKESVRSVIRRGNETNFQTILGDNNKLSIRLSFKRSTSNQ
jgi:hypothetical protein